MMRSSGGGIATTDGSAKVIRFHRLTDEHGCFTNFARFPVLLDGLVWPTSEHYFQSRKFTDARYADHIRQAKNPSLAARMGRSRDVPLRSDWSEIRTEVMRRVVRAKFVQHPRLRARLLDTGDRPLVEDTRGDYFWGSGKDCTGLNMNGRILMDVRTELRHPDPVVGQVARQLDARLAPREWVLFGNDVVVVPHRARGHAVIAAMRTLFAVAKVVEPSSGSGGRVMTGDHGTVAVFAPAADPAEVVRTAAADLDVRYAHHSRYFPDLPASTHD